MTRRRFFNRALLVVFGSFIASLAASAVAFVWAKPRAGFGSRVAVGPLDEIRTQLVQPDGTVTPLYVPSAQAYVVPFIGDIEASQFGSSAAAAVAIPGESGDPAVMALWQRCVHLGCRVPECVPSQGFECPCHGSRYNFHGEYEAGPAPRNLDRFAVEVTEDGDLVINTAIIVQTPRAKNKTAGYPQGPSCI